MEYLKPIQLSKSNLWCIKRGFTTFEKPEYILAVLAEIISDTLVKSAEIHFTEKSNKTVSKSKNQSKPNINKKYSKELMEAYKNHRQICKEWRNAGRPND